MFNMSYGNEKVNEFLVYVRVCPGLKIKSVPLCISELVDFTKVGLSL